MVQENGKQRRTPWLGGRTMSDLLSLQKGDKVWVRGCRDMLLEGRFIDRSPSGSYRVEVSGKTFSLSDFDIFPEREGESNEQ
jgi:hypothetical protein